MKKKPAESMPAAHSAALGLLVKFKDLSVGARVAEQERLVDQRFIAVTTKLLEVRPEEEAMSWLLRYCNCLDCMSIDTPESVKRLPRIDMINSEVSFWHLMEQVKFEVISSS